MLKLLPLFPGPPHSPDMLTAFFLIAAFNVALSAPALPLTAPSDHPTQIPLTNCVNPPPCRNIWEIIWSCTSILFICTWAAVHSNVPRKQDSGFTVLRQRTLIMLYAALAPECITMWALRQRVGAKKHMRDYNKRFYPNSELICFVGQQTKF